MTETKPAKDMLAHMDEELTAAGYERRLQTTILERILSEVREGERRAAKKERNKELFFWWCKVIGLLVLVAFLAWPFLPHRCKHPGCTQQAVVGTPYIRPDGKRIWSSKSIRDYCVDHVPEPIVSNLPWVLRDENAGEPVIETPTSDDAAPEETILQDN